MHAASFIFLSHWSTVLPDSQPAKEAQLLYTNSFLTGPNSPNQSELSDTTIIPISGLAVSKTW